MNLLLLTSGFVSFYDAVVKYLSNKGLNIQLFCVLKQGEINPIQDIPSDTLPVAANFNERTNLLFVESIIRKRNIQIVLNPNIQVFDLDLLIRRIKLKNPAVHFVDLIHSCPNFIVKNKEIELNEMTIKEVHSVKALFQFLFPSFYLSLLRGVIHYRMTKAYNLFDRTVLLSDAYVKEYQALYHFSDSGSKLVGIGNPSLKYQMKIPIEKKKKQILFVGRLSKEKMVSRLLLVWKQLFEKLPEWSLLIIGDGPQRALLEKMAADLRLQRISFEGSRSAIPYIDNASILCLTSNFEGLPTVYAEAMTLGCVVVGFDSFSAIYEMVDHEQSGIIVPAFHLDEYAKALLYLAQNDEVRCRMAYEAKEKVRQYDIATIANQWNKLWNSLL